MSHSQLRSVIKSIKTINEQNLQEIPYPQANNINKLFLFITYIGQGILDKDQLIDTLNIHGRQIDYYSNAMRYLGILNKRYNYFVLNPLGETFFKASQEEKDEIFITQCLKIPSIRKSYIFYSENQNSTKKDIVKILKDSKLNLSSEATYLRRASTVMKWIKYIDQNIYKLMED